MGQHEPIRRNTEGSNRPPAEIPDKLYFRIGEVAGLCEVPAYVLRFWESEFPQLKPNKGGTGQRLYRRRDVETALRIKRLLYDEGYTIPGARQVFKSEVKEKAAPQLPLLGTGTAPSAPDAKRFATMRRELQEIVAMLKRPVGEKGRKKAIHPMRPKQVPANLMPLLAASNVIASARFGSSAPSDSALDPAATLLTELD
jgi:DNA-binding transcriptional MerR regulator